MHAQKMGLKGPDTVDGGLNTGIQSLVLIIMPHFVAVGLGMEIKAVAKKHWLW